jgi:acetyl-CoA carboxylase biotin carboxyl carrier protein
VQIKAELAGNLWKIVVREGQQVQADETLMILESMKMEIPVTAPSAGRVTKLHAREGDAVQEGQLLIEVE